MNNIRWAIYNFAFKLMGHKKYWKKLGQLLWR